MTNSNLQTTIVIPTYNRNESLINVLPSYLNQKHVEEILIVDDGSSIEVEPFFKKTQLINKKVRFIRHNRSLGLCSARNTGIINTKTPWIFFGEDDLIISNNHIEILHKYRQKLNADIICGKVLTQEGDETLKLAEKINQTQKKLKLVNKKFITFDIRALSEPKELPFANAIFLTQTKLLKKYLFSTRIGGPSFEREDNEIQLCLRKNGKKLYAIPYATSLHLNRRLSYGSGTRLNKSIIISALGSIVNIYHVIDDYYDEIAPFFGNIPKTIMLRRAIFWNLYLETKRSLQSRYFVIDVIIKRIRRFF